MPSKFNLAASVQPSEMTAELLRIIAANEARSNEPFIEYDEMGNKCISFYTTPEMSYSEYRRVVAEESKLAEAEIFNMIKIGKK